ncbi:MAG: hypothetical protein IJS58_02850 [Bacilli bacterium]|nr:hypothetical protein [Bacilli bacterium]
MSTLSFILFIFLLWYCIGMLVAGLMWFSAYQHPFDYDSDFTEWLKDYIIQRKIKNKCQNLTIFGTILFSFVIIFFIPAFLLSLIFIAIYFIIVKIIIKSMKPLIFKK